MDKSNTVKLFVGNLALDTTQEELSAIFESYGQVVSCSVLRQFAFVHLHGDGSAERAIRELNGREFRGRNLVVVESRGRPLHSTKVFVGNLSGMCTTEDLQELFQTFGKVLECDKVKGEPQTSGQRTGGISTYVLPFNGHSEVVKSCFVAMGKNVIHSFIHSSVKYKLKS